MAMDEALAEKIAAINAEFYARVGASFDRTRQAPWEGWNRPVELAAEELGVSPRVLDLACGNLRFERFLAERGLSGEFLAVDISRELVDAGMTELEEGDAARIGFCELDIASALDTGSLGEELSFAAPFDLAVCFGFAHHLPLEKQREELLRSMLELTRAGGLVALSFWAFAEDAGLRTKAERTTTRACAHYGMGVLSDGDYFLDWQGSDIFRYCHSFTDAELDGLVAKLGGIAVERERFSADGRTGALNRYLVLERT